MATAGEKNYLVCSSCDALFNAPVVSEKERALCSRCGTHLFSRRSNFVQRSAAWTCAAALFFLLANAFPFLTLQADYRESYVHLYDCFLGLGEKGYPILGVMVGVFTVAAPALLICILLYVLAPLLQNRRLPGALPLCRVLQEARCWSMVEVFLLGVLVSLLKLGNLATLTLGTSFWAFGGLIVCLIAALASFDQAELWVELETASP